jgi:DNA end-binding protein Ku
MTIEKFVNAGSIDPIYYDTSYYLAPDGQAGRDVYAVLREAIAETERVALSRVVIGQRERTVALCPTDGGLVAHTLYESQDINDDAAVFDGATDTKTDPEMVKLAGQLIERQTADYDPSDTEDLYEARLRAMIDTKLKGEGIQPSKEIVPDRSNVVDLMSALKKSLGQAQGEEKPVTKPKRAAATQAAKSQRKRA